MKPGNRTAVTVLIPADIILEDESRACDISFFRKEFFIYLKGLCLQKSD
mgnify:FL=1